MSHPNPPKLGFFVNLQDFGDQIDGADSRAISQAIAGVVEAAVKATTPSIVAAVKDACIQAIRGEMNPTLLINQYKQDDLDQNMRRENLSITGLPEGGEGEGTEEVLINKICTLAKEVGVEMPPECIRARWRVRVQINFLL